MLRYSLKLEFLPEGSPAEEGRDCAGEGVHPDEGQRDQARQRRRQRELPVLNTDDGCNVPGNKAHIPPAGYLLYPDIRPISARCPEN